MTLKELKKIARRGITQWCNGMPEDGDYREPEIITDRWSGAGSCRDGDYAVIMIFHNKKEEGITP